MRISQGTFRNLALGIAAVGLVVAAPASAKVEGDTITLAGAVTDRRIRGKEAILRRTRHKNSVAHGRFGS